MKRRFVDGRRAEDVEGITTIRRIVIVYIIDEAVGL
jgi:hypothetical protein